MTWHPISHLRPSICNYWSETSSLLPQPRSTYCTRGRESRQHTYIGWRTHRNVFNANSGMSLHALGWLGHWQRLL